MIKDMKNNKVGANDMYVIDYERDVKQCIAWKWTRVKKDPPVGLFWFMPMEHNHVPQKGMMIEENGELQGIKEQTNGMS